MTEPAQTLAAAQTQLAFRKIPQCYVEALIRAVATINRGER